MDNGQWTMNNLQYLYNQYIILVTSEISEFSEKSPVRGKIWVTLRPNCTFKPRYGCNLLKLFHP
jgi:hypothetical protein